MSSSRWIPRSTPFPNFLIDQLMPRLRDTEWRVIVVVTRATLGWIDPRTGLRKQQEWLSSRQLRVRTGRESAAMSEAVDNLCSAKLIIIRDAYGKSVATKHDRRRARQRLSYGLHPDLLQRL